MHKKLTKAIAMVFVIYAGWASSQLQAQGPLKWHLVIEIAPAAIDKKAALQQTATVIRRRLDELGLPNSVKAQGASSNRILVSLPDVPYRQHVKKIITAGGRLELVAVISPPSPSPVTSYKTREKAAASMRGRVPTSVRVLPYVERTVPSTAGEDGSESRKPNRWVVVAAPAIVDGSELRTASVVEWSDEFYQVVFSLKAAGAEKFGAWTAANINNYLGVVFNDEVKSIAYIKSRIFDHGEITGRFTKQSAEDLALVLRSGALPAPVKIVSETVDQNQVAATYVW